MQRLKKNKKTEVKEINENNEIDINQLNNQISELNDELKNKKKELEKNELEIINLKNTNTELQSIIKDLEDEKEELKKTSDLQLIENNKFNSKNELDDKKQESYKILREKYDKLFKENLELKGIQIKYEQLLTETDFLKNKISELNDLQNENEDKDENNKNLFEENRKLKVELTTKEKEKQKLILENKELQNKYISVNKSLIEI